MDGDGSLLCPNRRFPLTICKWHVLSSFILCWDVPPAFFFPFIILSFLPFFPLFSSFSPLPFFPAYLIPSLLFLLSLFSFSLWSFPSSLPLSRIFSSLPPATLPFTVFSPLLFPLLIPSFLFPFKTTYLKRTDFQFFCPSANILQYKLPHGFSLNSTGA